MDKPLTEHIKDDGTALSLKEYEAVGGYQGLRNALKQTPEEVQQIVSDSNLRGRGGAGFPTGMKWSFVPMGDDARLPKYVVANADEMEPGTFKDRLLMEGNPHQLLEGMIITAYAIQASIGFVFLRYAYFESGEKIEIAIKEAYEGGYLGNDILNSGFSLEMHLHTSVGRYICGEESALLNALEGKRATPRNKPPFPQVSGLFGKPTIVNNVETFYNVAPILDKGADWFNSLSHSEKSGGTKLYGASGHVKNPAIWELPLGATLREILEEHAGGMQEGYNFKGVLPGGGSTDFLIEDHFDVPMDYEPVMEAGSRLGTGTLIVLDDKTCLIGFLHSLEKFFAQESCGWCTPCREGLPWARNILQALEDGKGRPDDIEHLEYQCFNNAPGNTFCALAPGAVEPLQSALNYFREDFEQHINEQRCPYH